MIPEAQRDIFDLLSQPDTYGPGVSKVERIDTHISSVFLAGDRVFKLKRAVTLPFLDFSTLEQRRAACQAEVALNRRTAPNLYRGLATVVRKSDGRLALGDGGEVVEWLVAMNRFDQGALLDRLAGAGRLSRDMMLDLAEAVADFHQHAEGRPQSGGRAGIAWTIANNLESQLLHAPAVFDAGQLQDLAARSNAELETVGDLLEHRRAEGFVRLCHGDLHLRNICLFEGKPTPFDAIEFSDAIASIDVWYDLAFLLMDLDFRGLRRWAGVVFNHYQQVTGDLGALRALPLFLSCRAGIRAHVAATIASQGGEQAAQWVTEARRYLAAALDYLAPQPPHLLAVGGLSGSGKSRMGRELAPFLGGCPGATVIRSDVLRKRLMGVDMGERLDQDGYTTQMTEKTYQALYDEVAQALVAGRCVVADAVFARPEQRSAIAAVAHRLGVPFTGLWLEADPKVMMERIRSRRRNASDATADVLRQQLDYDLGEVTWHRIDTSGAKGESLMTARQVLGV
jgi:aminoglycoside phosphotransferase family enzyme/predicted kinase